MAILVFSSACLKPEEWDKILESTKANLDKLIEKKEKKREKRGEKDPYMRISKIVKETIPSGEKQIASLEVLTNFEEKYKMIGKSYENLNTDEAEIFYNRHATREDLQTIANSLNTLRKSLADGYLEMLFTLKNNATEEEWSIIVKELNKF
jgi:hypothetical protein